MDELVGLVNWGCKNTTFFNRNNNERINNSHFIVFRGNRGQRGFRSRGRNIRNFGGGGFSPRGRGVRINLTFYSNIDVF